MATEGDGPLFESLGLAPKVVKSMLKNSKLCTTLREVVEEAGVAGGCDKSIGDLLYQVATKASSPRVKGNRATVIKYIMNGGIKSNNQLSAAVKFLKGKPDGYVIDAPEFEEACGVGVEVSEEQITAAIAAVITENEELLLRDRYSVLGRLFGEVKSTPALLWAEGKLVKDIWDAAILAKLGPKTAEDSASSKSKKKARKKANKKAAAAAAAADDNGGKKEEEEVGAIAQGFRGREISSAVNTPELIKKHLEFTKGEILTRFPPEPNGFCHIGHAKSMHLNFKTAFDVAGHSGKTYFRYDDTNPLAETQEFIDSQADNVAWLGWKPWKVTFSSDYFDQLYAFAIQLIKAGKAYVCHQTKADIERSRAISRARKGGDPNSPWRNRTVEENLAEFEKMRLGVYGEGEATLRMKIDNTHLNPCMWDPVAYRIMFVPHLKAGDKWCIYPSYDYTHCIVDSLENIDYSLCTLEFEVRRESYYWLLEALNLWRPYVWEFSRLNITYTMMSKRKILKLVNTGLVRGWDDPRICTLNGLRRRGYTPAAINAFCEDVGVTRNDNLIEVERLEHFARADMDANAKRTMAVLDPLRVILTNVGEDETKELVAPNFPKDKSRGQHSIHFNRVMYIERSDFREVDEKKYYGLAPGKTVGLRYAGLITCDEVVRGESGDIIELRCTYGERTFKPKGNLHWVCGPNAQTAPLTAEVRLYEQLFDIKEPSSADDWEDHIQTDSEQSVTAFVDGSMRDVAEFEGFQFERVGYFTVDKDSRPGYPVLNRTVTLRESSVKKRL